MKLEEMQEIWSEMSHQIEEQKIITNDLIMKMTKNQYHRKFDRLTFYESIGSVICFIMAFFILINFKDLNTWYLFSSGLFTVVFLIVLPILTLGSIGRLKRLDVSRSNLKEMIIKYKKYKGQLLLIQRLGIYLSFLLMFTVLPVFSKIMKGKDLFIENHSLLLIYMLVMSVFLLFFSRWGYKCYQNITKSAEDVLKELDMER
ncbi:hypothetical protein [Eudoraea chungangensis]|uniref:hypothetical protein n=1 Tax=Eudoraea chungangensis TaxID=1481905 RepID=UPI0023EC4C32|nr:hypothetical protein [Eudoraea chungangensis]